LETLYKELEKNIMILIIDISERKIQSVSTGTALPYQRPRLPPLSVTVISSVSVISSVTVISSVSVISSVTVISSVSVISREVVTLRASSPGITTIAYLWKERDLNSNTFLIDIIWLADVY
jgi:hypothetical protein